MTCRGCGHIYLIQNGIPNMVSVPPTSSMRQLWSTFSREFSCFIAMRDAGTRYLDGADLGSCWQSTKSADHRFPSSSCCDKAILPW